MTPEASVVLAALMSVTFGYEPSKDADVGYDYIVQVEPGELDDLKSGKLDDIQATLPRDVNPVRRVRIVVGSGEVPRKLRAPKPGEAHRRTAFRPDADSGDMLLAQTGPAGGFGRSSTGFNSGRSRTESTPPAIGTPAVQPAPAPNNSTANNTTIPPIQYRTAPQYQTPAPYQPAPQPQPSTMVNNTAADINRTAENAWRNMQQGLQNTGDQIRQPINSVLEGTQNFVDNTRQTASDLIGPPNQRYNDQNTVISNMADRTRSEFENAGQALRDSVDRVTGAATQGQFGQQQPITPDYRVPDYRTTADHTTTVANDPNTNQYNQQPPQPDNRALSSDRYAQQERSLLNNVGAGQAADPRFTGSPQLEPPAINVAPQPIQQPRKTSEINEFLTRGQGAAGNPSTVERDLNQGFGGPTQPASNSTNVSFPGGGGDNWRRDVQPTGTSQQNPITSTNNNLGPAIQANKPTGDTGNTANGQNQQSAPEIRDNASTELTQHNHSTNDANQNNVSNTQNTGGTTAPTFGRYVFAWAIAIGLAAVNAFQWINMLDLRNKYRVALRRNSPSFSRSMAA